ncbi:ABC transporter substrate-binding protein [Cellulomonas sp. KRMCY2]|uniref:ABC transporter substrate-binding protein n=1 Tax=Cellulomonas sp. KRMCY2 TaxID=1304865 RepID=UPI0004AF0AA4|nr:ABC transporter substrate-binding protein [Cellulomonas sp. KRMCY2]
MQFWTGFTGGDRPAYEAIVADFNASQSEIKVEFSAEPWDSLNQKLPSALLTSDGPDIATLDGNSLAHFVETSAIIPITNTGDGDSEINVDQFSSELVDQYSYDGTLYAVPANFATLSLYYNKALLEASGITEPPASLEDFQADAKALTSGDTYGLVLADHDTIPMWPILQWMAGGTILDGDGCSQLDTEEGIASLQSWADLVVNDKISPVGLSGAEADSVFSAGKAAMEMNGPWAAAGYKDAGIDLGIAPIPTGVDGPVTLGSSGPIGVSAKSAHPDEAQAFLAYYTGKVAQLKFSLASGFPSFRTDLADEASLKADPVVSVFTDQVAGARFYPGKVPNASAVDLDGYTPMIQSITRGTAVADAAKEATTAIDGATGCTK